MSSEYIQGHEYDTYHLEDKAHRPVHFVVTRPSEHDVIEKGAYFHAHPEQVDPSYGHEEYHVSSYSHGGEYAHQAHQEASEHGYHSYTEPVHHERRHESEHGYLERFPN